MSSDSAFWPAPSTSRSPRRTLPPPSPPLDQQWPHSTKTKTKKSKGSSSSSKEKKRAEVPLSLKGQIFQLLAMCLVAWLVAAWGIKSIEWVKQQFKPFCDNDSDSAKQAQTPEECIPCPGNGSCRDGKLECFVGFKKVGKLCVKDKEIDQTAEKLVGYLRNRVCGIAAHAVCDGDVASGAVWLTEDDVRAQLKEEGLQEQFGLDEKSWLLVWEKMARIAEDSITMQTNLDGKREFKCPRELVQHYKPMKCQIREWIVANLVTFLITSPLVALVASFIIKCIKRRKTNARAEQVYLQVCEVLEEKALESTEMAAGESWVVVSRLRDHILLPSERKWTALWRQVEVFVKEDSRIDQYQKKVKSEMKIVWEWQVEGAIHTPGVRNKVQQTTHTRHASSTQQQPQRSANPQQI